MDSQKWQSFLHWSFLGEHVLLEDLQLESFWGFLVGAFLTSILCFAERLLTFAMSSHWNPFPSIRSSRWRNALWRSGLYWIATFIRLLYMLIAMSYHIGLIMVTVTALAAGQFIIELLDIPQHQPSEGYTGVPLINAGDESMAHSGISRNRSRSKPNGSLSYSDAIEMGLTGDSELVGAHSYPSDLESRGVGIGKDAARGTGGRRNSQQQFRIGDADAYDSD